MIAVRVRLTGRPSTFGPQGFSARFPLSRQGVTVGGAPARIDGASLAPLRSRCDVGVGGLGVSIGVAELLAGDDAIFVRGRLVGDEGEQLARTLRSEPETWLLALGFTGMLPRGPSAGGVALLHDARFHWVRFERDPDSR